MRTAEPICMENLDDLVEEYMALIIRTASTVTGRYICVENDDAFSIALQAFAEAVERFSPDRGAFPGFAALVMKSRLLSYLQSENRQQADVSLEAMEENGQDLAQPSDENLELRSEIQTFVGELTLFDLSLEQLVDQAPKHTDTRVRAVGVAERSSQDDGIVSQTYRKRKLPVRAVARLCQVSDKIVKGSKTFILATMLVFIKKLPNLISWIKETG